MKNVYFILFCCLVVSCISKTDNSKNVYTSKENQVGKVNILKLGNNVDRVEIECFFFGEFNDRSFVVRLTNDKLIILLNDDESEIKNDHNHQYLINYINKFYIEKKERIVVSKNAEPAPVADYPSILVRVFKNNKEILVKEEILYSNMEFNPSFIAFYSLLNDLIQIE
ncbi:hypothetical protein [Myroides odoratimimus]|uniref:hypothetical protein n=1 Tax=Myroides odoratimimus TaxID=76832 RepID=UPI0031011A40